MKHLLALFTLSFLFGSCSSSKLVDQYLNPDNAGFKADKVLVVGFAPEGWLQKEFEFSLAQALKKENIDAVKSVDFFGEDINKSTKYGQALEGLREDLVRSGFDAVVFSRITGRDSKVSLAQSYRNLVRTFQVFDQYSETNPIIYESDKVETSPILHTETFYYCLCPERTTDLIWKGNIDIVNSTTSEEAVQDYVKTLIKALRKNDILGQ